jgi:hypothetical protein
MTTEYKTTKNRAILLKITILTTPFLGYLVYHIFAELNLCRARGI